MSISLTSGAKVCISDINSEIGQQTAKEFSENYGKDNVSAMPYRKYQGF